MRPMRHEKRVKKTQPVSPSPSPSPSALPKVSPRSRTRLYLSFGRREKKGFFVLGGGCPQSESAAAKGGCSLVRSRWFRARKWNCYGGTFFLFPLRLYYTRRYIPSFSLPLAKSGRIKVRPWWWRMQQPFKVFAEFRGERERRGFVAKGKERHTQKLAKETKRETSFFSRLLGNETLSRRCRSSCIRP